MRCSEAAYSAGAQLGGQGCRCLHKTSMPFLCHASAVGQAEAVELSALGLPVGALVKLPCALLLSSGRPGQHLHKPLTVRHDAPRHYHLMGGNIRSVRREVVRLAEQQPAAANSRWHLAIGLQVQGGREYCIVCMAWHLSCCSAQQEEGNASRPPPRCSHHSLSHIPCCCCACACACACCRPCRLQQLDDGPQLVLGAVSGPSGQQRAAVLDDQQQALLEALAVPLEWVDVGGATLCPVPPADSTQVHFTGGLDWLNRIRSLLCQPLKLDTLALAYPRAFPCFSSLQRAKRRP